MNKQLGAEFESQILREAFLKDNCDNVEVKGYMKPFTQEELQTYKETLANISIELDELNEQRKRVNEHIKLQMKPLLEKRTSIITNIKEKTKYVRETCYKFVDLDARETGYYNAEGMLVDCRPSTVDELQPTIFSMSRKTGTDNN